MVSHSLAPAGGGVAAARVLVWAAGGLGGIDSAAACAADAGCFDAGAAADGVAPGAGC